MVGFTVNKVSGCSSCLSLVEAQQTPLPSHSPLPTLRLDVSEGTEGKLDGETLETKQRTWDGGCHAGQGDGRTGRAARASSLPWPASTAAARRCLVSRSSDNERINHSFRA